MTDDAAATQAVLPDAESESAPDTPEPETRAGAANSDKSLGSLLAPVRGRLILAGAFQALGALMSLVRSIGSSRSYCSRQPRTATWCGRGRSSP